ncbi:IS5 family transposase [Myxococcus faecalis]|uniref:IS5 family transposase n=1 Tax=Myxococcus faecalis TaxID=3115646 RepID=UPI003CECD2D4
MPRRELVPDAFWRRIQPLIPARPPKPKGGRPPADDRACLRGIIFVLTTGIQWEQLPREVFGVSGMTCWRRLRDWYQAGVWQALQRELLAELRRKGRLDLRRASADSSSVRALKKGAATGPNPTDRAKAGSKHHLLVDRRGRPLAVRLTAANRPDVRELLPLVDAVPPIRGRRGRPRRRPTKVHGDKGYASTANRRGLRERGIIPRIARPGIDSSERLGRYRWVVEQRLAILHRFRRLRMRDERRADIHEAFLLLACDLMLLRSLVRFC